jgi:hypothetical protein
VSTRSLFFVLQLSMNKLPVTSQNTVFAFMCDVMDPTEFKESVAADRNFMTYLGAAQYQWLIESSFEAQEQKIEILDKLSKHKELCRYESYRIRLVLHALIHKTDKFIEALYQSYELYADGYFFLETVGVQHGLSFSNTYFNFYEWEKLPEAEKIVSIAAIYSSVKVEALKISNLLDDNRIKLTGKRNSDGSCTYIDLRNDLERLSSYDSVSLKDENTSWVNIYRKTKQKLQLLGSRTK